MQNRDQSSMPVGIHHVAKLMERINGLERRIAALENVRPDYIEFVQRSGDPSTPASNRARLYCKDNAGNPRLYQIDDLGNVNAL